MTQKYELIVVSPDIKIQGNVFAKGKILLGRSESCDLIIHHDAISTVHAVLEVSENKATIFDMNSTNGVYVGDQKVISKEIPLDSNFRLADIEFTFKKSGELPKLPSKVSDSLPTITSQQSEYIFEDKDELYPIFKYESVNRATEVIILYKEKVFSIDYLREGNGTYFLSGKADSRDELEFPYLIKNQKVQFIEVHKGSCEVHTIPGFEITYVGDKKLDPNIKVSSYELHDNDLVKLHKGDLQIFVRNVVSPPKVLAAPFFKRDSQFRNAFFLSFAILVAVSIGANMVEKPSATQNEYRSIQRLATILDR